MASKADLQFDNEQSQFRIEQNSKRKKMMASNKNNRYSVITYEKRVQLINLASSKGYSISRAARELGIKPSTGKFIVKCFRDNGKIMKKTTSQQSRLTQNCQQCSGSQTGNQKQEKDKENCQLSDLQQNQSQKKEKQETLGNYAYGVEAPFYVMEYPYEQSLVNPIFFYSNFGCMNNMGMPVFFPQTAQY